MAQIDLGKLKFQWQGLWQTATAYEVDDVVHDEGTTYVVTTAVPATNTTRPGESPSFEIMARGVNFRGAYDAQATYLHLEIVTFEGASWISVQSDEFTGQEPSEQSTFWDILTPAPDESVLTTRGDMVYRGNTDVTVRLPIGNLGSTLQVVEDPQEDIDRLILYTVGTGTTATAIATDGNDATNVFGDNTTNGALTLSRGRTYVFTFPANGQTYSIKDPNAANYSTSGTNGRVTAGVTPDFVTDGGSLSFSPDSGTPNTVVVRNEANGVDELTITIVDMARVPAWSGGVLQDDLVDRAFNDYRNTMTEALAPIPQHKDYGRGALFNSNPGTTSYQRMSVVGRSGRCVTWGNFYNDATNGQYYGSHALGRNHAGTEWVNCTQTFRLPDFYLEAIAGVANESKWLTDLNGNSIGYGNVAVAPKVIQAWTNSTHSYVLTENGMVFHAGYGAQPGADGAGSVLGSNYTYKYLRPHAANSTELTGTDRPKMKMFTTSLDTDAGNTGSFYCIDTNGRVYSMGDNGVGQLGVNNTTDNFFLRQIDPARFNNEKVLFINAAQSVSASVYAITETGKCYGWGDNSVGQLGIGSTTNQSLPVEITGIAGSPLEDKKVIHVCQNNSATLTYAHTYFLTDEGKVYAAGDAETFGVYLGVYDSGSANQTTPVELTNASTTINSDNQKVVSMWCSQGRYNTLYMITDGGDSNNVRIYATGNNSDRQQCAGNDVATAHGASATAQGTWFLNECEFMTSQAGTDSDIRANVTTRRIGDPMIVYTGCVGSAVANGWRVMLDSNGTAWIGGRWSTYNPNTYTEIDNEVDFNGTETSPRAWQMLHCQPEPFVSVCFGSDTLDQEGWVFVGESGLMYIGGYDGGNQAGGMNTHSLNVRRLSS